MTTEATDAPPVDAAPRHLRAVDRIDGRVPPHNLDIEESVLGACLISRDAIDATIDAGLQPEHFYKPAHSHIYAAILELHHKAAPVDARIVADELTRAGLLDTIGGATVLLGLVAGVPATSNAGKYASIVVDHALLRSLIGAASEIAEVGYSLPADVAAALDAAEQRIYKIADSRTGDHPLFTLHDLLDTHLDLLEARSEGTVTLGAPTGIHHLDELLGGQARGQLIVLAGRPGMAKTVTALGFAVSAATEGVPALFASIEMPRSELMDRLVAGQARVDLEHLRSGNITDRDWPRITDAYSRISQLPLTILDDAGASVATIRSAARRAAREGLGVVVVDYLQIVHVTKATGDRRVDVDEISRGLKRLARDLNVAVVVCCQLNRNVETRAEKRPLLSDLRESGQIEQDADVVIGLYRDDYYHPDSTDRGVIELNVLKQRNGPTGTIRAAFLGQYQLIANMADAR